LSGSDFRKLLLQAVDEGLASLGDSSKEAIYFHLDKDFKVKKEQIPSRLDDFTAAIESIFGMGANFLEILIMKQLYEKVGGNMHIDESAKLAFTEYVAAARRAFHEKEKIGLTEGFVECETAEMEE
jgi:hypothetical protein